VITTSITPTTTASSVPEHPHPEDGTRRTGTSHASPAAWNSGLTSGPPGTLTPERAPTPFAGMIRL
jgi:hypothetical protein